jgi:hypothetical protein
MTELHVNRFFLMKALLTTSMGCALLLSFNSACAQASSLHASGAVHAPPLAPDATVAKVPPKKSSAWLQLTPMQRQALAPLGAQWSALSAQQQNKWLTISKNFTQLPVADQVTMHSRMADWVDLSPQQRNLARLNFNQLQSLPKEDKKAKWEAYQALSEAEKRSLFAGTASPAKSAAPTAKPVEAYRQVQTPLRSASGSAPQAAAIDRKTLLPLQPHLATPTPIQAPASATDLPEGLKPSSETAPS